MKLTGIISYSLLTGFLFFCGCKKEDKTPSAPVDDSINSFASITVGNQNNPVGCFINLRNGTVYNLQDAFAAQDQIDLIFYNDAPSNSPWFSSPADLSMYTTYDQYFETSDPYGVSHWSTLNTIKISNSDITSATFESMTTSTALSQTIADDYHAMIGAVPEVLPGVVYKFITFNGKAGLIRVNAVTGNAQVNGNLKMDIKVQK